MVTQNDCNFGTGSSGQVLTSNGAGVSPTFQAIPASGGLAWSVTSGTFTAVASNGYFINGVSSISLPASPSTGDTIAFIEIGSGNITILPNGKGIRIGDNGGVVTSVTDNTTGSLTFVYQSTTTTWEALSVLGTWTIHT